MWEEVRRLNDDLGMTIFLTTQYLEEADELADRVGIIDDGRIVAEGTPEELKRSVGADVIVARIDGDLDVARRAVAGIEGVGRGRGPRRRAHGRDRRTGPAAISPVAVALSGCGVRVRELTLRTPTLDDVFLELTGNRIQNERPKPEVDAR